MTNPDVIVPPYDAELMEQRARADRAVAELDAWKEALTLLGGPAMRECLPSLELIARNILATRVRSTGGSRS